MGSFANCAWPNEIQRIKGEYVKHFSTWAA